MKKIVVEVEIPEGMEWVKKVAQEIINKLIAYTLLQEKANGEIDEKEIERLVEEAKQQVWERVKYAYTRS